jgi:hypothetical protein
MVVLAATMMIPQTQRKVREARFFLEHLRDRAGDLPLDSERVRFYLSALLSAGRSVTFVLQTEEKGKYDAWYPAWEGGLDLADQHLLRYLNDQRVAEVHKVGADVSSTIDYKQVAELRVERGGRWKVLFVAPPGAPPPEIGFATHHFKVGDDLVDLRDVCERYVSLLEHLVRAFLAAHTPGAEVS